jgi:hypothetical protein
VTRLEVPCIHTYEDSRMKPTKHCLKKEGEEEWEYSGGMNFFKVHCMPVWKIPLYY